MNELEAAQERTDAALEALLEKMPAWIRRDWEPRCRELVAAVRNEAWEAARAVREGRT